MCAFCNLLRIKDFNSFDSQIKFIEEMLSAILYKNVIICGLIFSNQKVRFQYKSAFNYSRGFKTILSGFHLCP